MTNTDPKKVKFHNFTSGLYLVIFSIVLTLIGLFIVVLWHASHLSQINALALLALISGLISTLTNVNDRRITSLRVSTTKGTSIRWDENSHFLNPAEFLAWGGLMGVFFSFISLFFVYIIFSIPIENIWMDLQRSSQLSFFGVPAFIVAGLATIISTLAYLSIVQKALLYLIFYVAGTAAMNLFLGLSRYNDPVLMAPLTILLSISSFFLFFKKEIGRLGEVSREVKRKGTASSRT